MTATDDLASLQDVTFALKHGPQTFKRLLRNEQGRVEDIMEGTSPAPAELKRQGAALVARLQGSTVKHHLANARSKVGGGDHGAAGVDPRSACLGPFRAVTDRLMRTLRGKGLRQLGIDFAGRRLGDRHHQSTQMS